MPILESSYYQIDEIDDHAMEPPPIEREREGQPGEVDERLLKSVIKSKMGHPSWPSLAPSLHRPPYRLSALGPLFEREKEWTRRRDRSIADGAWRVFRKRDCNNNACLLPCSLARSTGEWRTRPEAAAAPAEVSSLGMLIC